MVAQSEQNSLPKRHNKVLGASAPAQNSLPVDFSHPPLKRIDTFSSWAGSVARCSPRTW